ncbi:MAG: hypothetical protein AB1405_06470 [Bdellovibrionota bacterium]
MAVFLLNAFSSLLDLHKKLVLVTRSFETLSRQTERVSAFMRAHPEVKVDWLEYATGFSEAESQIEAAFKKEQELKKLFSEWTERNFTSYEAQRVKVDLEALGIKNLSGVQVPLTFFKNLGDGDFSDLLQKTVSLGFEADSIQRNIETLEKSQISTLQKVRQVLKGYPAYSETLKDLDALIVANSSDRIPRAGFGAGFWVLAITGLWLGFKVWNWKRNAEARRILSSARTEGRIHA